MIIMGLIGLVIIGVLFGEFEFLILAKCCRVLSSSIRAKHWQYKSTHHRWHGICKYNEWKGLSS